MLSFGDLFAAFTRPVRAVFVRLEALRGSYSSSRMLFVSTLSFMFESQLIYYQMTFLVIVCAISSRFVTVLSLYCTDLYLFLAVLSQ